MDKTFFIYVVTGLVFAYFIITNVHDIQAEDERYQNNQYQQEHKYDKYYTTDSVGQDIIDVYLLNDYNKQKEVWNHSRLKEETLEYFPDFSMMREFVKDRVVGEPLQSKLIEHFTKVEDDFITGKISADEARRRAVLLK